MKRRLFLTGPMGCGKSTAIANALGAKITGCGGFLTRRYREPYLHFRLEIPDGSRGATFLTFASGKADLKLQVFSELGIESLRGNALVLDEIGGIELLQPEFSAALKCLLERDVPILGVLKGEGPAGALIEALGLTEAYERAAAELRNFLRSDPDTMVYECGHFDKYALRLAEQWAEEYLHE